MGGKMLNVNFYSKFALNSKFKSKHLVPNTYA